MASAPKRIFISHASADTGLARTVADELRIHGFDAWLDEHEVQPGASWRDAVSKQLDSSDAFVVLVSEASQHSPWARLESSEILKRAWADDTKVVLPVIVGSAEPPGFLRDRLAVRLESGVEDLLQRLVAQALPGGVSRSKAGDARLERRLKELEETAASLATAEDEAG